MTEIAPLLIAAVAAYLLGSVLGGSVLARLRGLDLRSSGSGNIGATNALRAGGKGLAIGVLLIDVGKGAVAVLAIPLLLGADDTPTMAYVCGVAVALGHCFPPWLRFRGGKGVATLAGVFIVLLPGTFLAVLVAWLLTLLATGFVSLASIVGAIVALVYAGLRHAALPEGAVIFVTAMAALVLVKHRGNIANLLAGREYRFENAAVLRRWLKNRRN